jgi:hypothetical protein
MRKAAVRYGKRTAARIQAIRRKAAEWKRRARRALTLALVTAGIAAAPSLVEAQMGQTAMAPAGGILNRAVAGFQGLNDNGPGWLYYGLNAADRGLGYNGGYMTLGGFVPYAEDDLGGFWAADLRSHLSEYGGFFSNLGMVRKQFLGGTLFGVGVYWDYDADANQYPTGGALGTSQFGQFGHVYNQVGVSLEWLTDYGNLRSNGYIPVGSTGYTAGAPGNPFFQNFVMCQNGLDAALTGTDLEVGAYIPGLADWAGMVSVGGYAYGNSRYDWQGGPLAGQDIVPWFGGVYTRLDMTFVENWDFSLQANNDSYFDWTGFARLTYRMGGSRRRNVPDQVEQPMMRNEHIVRAHQTPIVALNPSNGNQPWRVIHVNNAAAPGGNGSAAAPFTTLAQGDAAATRAWDIVFVDRGTGTPVGYDTTFSFNKANQSLVGNGSPFRIATASCGLVDIATKTAGGLPLLSNPGGTSVLINNTPGAVVSNLRISGSATGISASGNLTGAAKPAGSAGNPAGTTPPGASVVSNVSIEGNNTSAPQRGVEIKAASGAIAFYDTSITDMNNTGLLVQGNNNAKIDYQGSITSNVATNGGVATPIIDVLGNSGSEINVAFNGPLPGGTVPNAVTDIGGQGIVIEANDSNTDINIGNVTLVDSAVTAIQATNDFATTKISQDAGQGITKSTNGAAVAVSGGAPTFAYQGQIQNAFATTPATSSYLLSVSDTIGGSVTIQAPAGSPFLDTANGISIQDANGDVIVSGGAQLSGKTAQGIIIDGNSAGQFEFDNVVITGATNEGVLINGSLFSGSATFNSLDINLAGTAARGFVASNSASAGTIVIQDLSRIQTASTTVPSLILDNILNTTASLTTAASGVPNATGTAIDIGAGTGGNVTVTSQFTVGGTPGTVANNVQNAGTATVTVPPP